MSAAVRSLGGLVLVRLWCEWGYYDQFTGENSLAMKCLLLFSNFLYAYHKTEKKKERVLESFQAIP